MDIRISSIHTACNHELDAILFVHPPKYFQVIINAVLFPIFEINQIYVSIHTYWYIAMAQMPHFCIESISICDQQIQTFLSELVYSAHGF